MRESRTQSVGANPPNQLRPVWNRSNHYACNTEELNKVRIVHLNNVLSVEQKPLTTPKKHRRVDHIEDKLFVMMINVFSDVEQ